MLPLTKPPVDFDKLLFRASKNGVIMTESRDAITEIQLKRLEELCSKPKALTDKQREEMGKLIMKKNSTENDSLSQTCKSYLRKLYRSLMWNRPDDDIMTKYMEKGLMVEEDVITLYSRSRGIFFKKNDVHLSNEFVKGHPDLFEDAEVITEAKIITDMKASWDATTFPFPTDPISTDYEWQGHTYLDLTGAETFQLVFGLIDTPLVLQNDEKRRLMYKMGAGTDEDPLYKEAVEKLERNMNFSDIPIEERICTFELKRDQAKIEKLHKQVVLCRKFLWELYESYKGKTIPVEELEQAS